VSLSSTCHCIDYLDFGHTDYSKLPPNPPIDFIFVLDPLVATGGTTCAAVSMIVDWGVPSQFLFHDHALNLQNEKLSFSQKYQVIECPSFKRGNTESAG
jgi:hypothetical protein